MSVPFSSSAYVRGETEAKLTLKYAQKNGKGLEKIQLANGKTVLGVRFGTYDKPTHTHYFFQRYITKQGEIISRVGDEGLIKTGQVILIY